MADLSRLSAELIILIAEQLDAESLISFLHTDRRIYAFASAVYFKHEATSEASTLLFWAARHGRANVVQKLVDHGADINRRDQCGKQQPIVKNEPGHPDYRTESPVLQARNVPDSPADDFVELDELEDVSDSEFLEEEREHYARAWQPTWTALHLAAANGHKDIVELLLNHGADIDAEASGLCKCGQPSKGCRDNYLFPYPNPTWTALHTAICQGHDSIAAHLLHRGASLETDRDPRGTRTSSEAARSLFWDGEDSDYPDTYMRRQQAWPVFDDIVDGPNRSDSHPAPGRPWYTALHYTAAYGSLQMVELIHKARPGDLDLPDAAGQTPLAYAFRVCRVDDVIPYLVRHGADPDGAGTSMQTWTPLLLASRTHQFQHVVMLAKLGAMVGRRAPLTQLTALHLCCSLNNEHKGTNLEVWPWWPRPKAVDTDEEDKPYRLEAVRVLLDHGAEVDALDSIGRTPLSYAVEDASLAVIQLLLASGANPSSHSYADLLKPEGRDDYGYDDCVSVLIAAACSRPARGRAPYRVFDVFACILQAGADVNFQNEHGNTILHILCRGFAKDTNLFDRRMSNYRRTEHIKALVACGSVDYSLRNNLGQLAVEYIMVEGATHVAELFPIDAVRWHITRTNLISARDIIIGFGCSGDRLKDKVKALEFLHGIDPHFVFVRPESLFSAIMRGNEDLAVTLIDRGANYSYWSKAAGESLLHVACRKRLSLVIDKLLDLGIPSDKPSRIGNTPLSIYFDSILRMALGGPIEWDTHPTVITLIQHGADPHRVVCKPPPKRATHFYEWFERPLDRIISRGDHMFARKVLEICPPRRPSDDTGGLGYAYLHCACSFSYKVPDLDFVEYLLSLGLDVNERNCYGRTVLSELIASITPTAPWNSPFRRTPATSSKPVPASVGKMLQELTLTGLHSPLSRPDLFIDCIRLLEKYGADWTKKSSAATLPSSGEQQRSSDSDGGMPAEEETTPAEELAQHLDYAGPDTVSRQGLDYIKTQLADTAWRPAEMWPGGSPFARTDGRRPLDWRRL
ncbi:serine/threonine-protein phosphatase 6 regulatory ankyrin repeat subunit A [Microdochium nivale]|nr:serine/threonine-protein phosphatase 6 regulatory ankyrin repeat subunit A [Microdochium nivale]